MVEDRPNTLCNLFPTLWCPLEPPRTTEAGYYIVEMRSWGYGGPVDNPQNDIYELEIHCTRAQHQLVQDWVERNPGVAFPRILGYESQGLQGAQRHPQALMITFKGAGKREEFQLYWQEVSRGS